MTKIFNPLVSIVIPVYNGSNYLKQAIDSALAQTYKNIEIIVINDGSNDNGKTEKIAKSYGKKIRYYSKPNGGVASALNLGIKEMKGEYFSWLSHDDLYYPDKIEKQVSYLKNLNKKNVILFSNYCLIDEKGKSLGSSIFSHDVLENVPEYALLRGNINGITLLIPKKAFKDCEYFDEELRYTQDYNMWHKMMKFYKFLHMEEILSATRIHSGQDTTKASQKLITECNALWIRMVESVSDSRKIEIEGSLYNFYSEMEKFLQTTKYTGAMKYCSKKAKEIFQEAEKQAKNIKVSVVTPFFNRVSLLERSIESVVKQDHVNFELLLIDDGSNEDYSFIKKKYKNDQRIKFYKLTKNSGPAVARNFGIEKSNGEYVAFLDSDDLFNKNKISRQLGLMVATKSKFSHTSYIRKYNKIVETVDTSSLCGNVIPSIIGCCTIATPTVMVQRDILRNKRFDERYRVAEDVCLWIKIASETPFLAINENLTIVNIHNTTTDLNQEKSIQGLKNTLRFVLNNKQYYNYNDQISNLCAGVWWQHRDGNCNYLNQMRISVVPERNILKRLARSCYRDGIVVTFKKIAKRLVFGGMNK